MVPCVLQGMSIFLSCNCFHVALSCLSSFYHPVVGDRTAFKRKQAWGESGGSGIKRILPNLILGIVKLFCWERMTTAKSLYFLEGKVLLYRASPSPPLPVLSHQIRPEV